MLTSLAAPVPLVGRAVNGRIVLAVGGHRRVPRAQERVEHRALEGDNRRVGGVDGLGAVDHLRVEDTGDLEGADGARGGAELEHALALDIGRLGHGRRVVGVVVPALAQADVRNGRVGDGGGGVRDGREACKPRIAVERVRKAELEGGRVVVAVAEGDGSHPIAIHHKCHTGQASNYVACPRTLREPNAEGESPVLPLPSPARATLGKALALVSLQISL